MGRPRYILLVRHGESEGNCDKSVNRYTPNHKVCLTSQGHYQATAAGAVLKDFLEQLSICEESPKKNARSVMFYTSPYLRARQTCNNIVEGIKDVEGVEYDIKEEPRMREQDFGNFQSTAEEMEKIWEERAHYGHFFYRIPHGESAADVYDRISSFNETLFRQFQQDDFPNILVLVTHGVWARVFLMKWFRWSYEEFESLKNIPHCQYLIMKKDEDSKFSLKTRLHTWDDDDLADSELDEQVSKEVGDEVCFNSKNKISNPEDLDIQSIIKAQREAIRSTREKNRQLKDMYEKIHNNGYTDYASKRISRFKIDNQSVVNSAEDLSAA
ncbi:histidine phosphatase superfamily [Scheffersomyces coipomensis]|uniref:histidine phosphatase superfamily n=1 Tax=Scheffersomyces coipomensis TaxID=1788519 RepID=UPI00315CA443